MNNVSIMGRITHDIEMKQTASGTNTVSFTVAVDRRTKDETTADFIRCVAWGKNAEFISRYFGKGKPIIVHGNLKTGSYDDKNGNKVFTTDVWVDRAEFTLSDKSQGNAPQEQPQPTPQASTPNEFESEVISDGDLPF